MIATPEIVSSLTGAVRLALGDAGGMSCFNRTIEGFWNSFFAAVIAAPGYLALGLLTFEESPPADSVRVFLVESIAYVIGWVAFPLAMVYVARLLRRENRYIEYIVAFNWAQVPQVLLFLAGAILANGLGMTGPAAGMLVSILSIAVVVYFWFIAKTAFEVNSLQAAGLVGLDILITLAISIVSAGLKAGAL
jgi:hypothetical protein